MESSNIYLSWISYILFLILLFKDTSGKNELREIRKELEKLRKGNKD